jgi:manganese-dependent inorganic pyrophosphatase
MTPPDEAGSAGEKWDPNLTYVVGHQRPDTDSIGAALGYAWYLTATGEANVVPARAGHPGEQTLWALRRFEVGLPRPLTAVAPTFAHVMRREPSITPETLLQDAVPRLAAGQRVVPVVDPSTRRPDGAVTALALARAYAFNALARPCRETSEALPTFIDTDRIQDHRGALLRSGGDDFLVTDTAGRYLGMATRGRVLEPPRARLVLVDHNELGQAVAHADEAEIVAVLDHHRLGNAPTAAPIPFVIEPVGSTCTLVAERCRAGNLPPSAGLAGMLLSGILSDTLVYRSPTVTERDQAAGAWLADLCGVDIPTFGKELLGAAPGLGDRDAAEIVDADRKAYEMGGLSVSIAQIEVRLKELPGRRDDLLEAMEALRVREGLALICLLVTDVVTGRSHMLCRGENRLLTALPFDRVGEGEWDLENIVSRKKQLVPILQNVLDELR